MKVCFSIEDNSTSKTIQESPIYVNKCARCNTECVDGRCTSCKCANCNELYDGSCKCDTCHKLFCEKCFEEQSGCIDCGNSGDWCVECYDAGYGPPTFKKHKRKSPREIERIAEIIMPDMLKSEMKEISDILLHDLILERIEETSRGSCLN